MQLIRSVRKHGGETTPGLQINIGNYFTSNDCYRDMGSHVSTCGCLLLGEWYIVNMLHSILYESCINVHGLLTLCTPACPDLLVVTYTFYLQPLSDTEPSNTTMARLVSALYWLSDLSLILNGCLILHIIYLGPPHLTHIWNKAGTWQKRLVLYSFKSMDPCNLLVCLCIFHMP